MILIYLLLAVTGGFFMAFQSPTNTALSSYTGNFQAAAVSFGGGTLILALLVLVTGQGDLSRITEAEWWQLLGGFYGAFIVLMVTYASPVLGIALTLTLSMLGQIIMGSIIDYFGLFLIEPSPVSGGRVAGCTAVAAGIVLVYIGKRKQDKNRNELSSKSILMGVLIFSGGVGGAIQSPTNAALAVHTGKAEASLVSFTAGFLILLIFTLIVNRGKLKKMTGMGIRPWMMTGGVYGSAVVFFNVIATPYLGAALMVAASMLGLLSGALIIDTFGIMRSPKIRLERWRLTGVALIAAGVILVTWSHL